MTSCRLHTLPLHTTANHFCHQTFTSNYGLNASRPVQKAFMDTYLVPTSRAWQLATTRPGAFYPGTQERVVWTPKQVWEVRLCCHAALVLCRDDVASGARRRLNGSRCTGRCANHLNASISATAAYRPRACCTSRVCPLPPPLSTPTPS